MATSKSFTNSTITKTKFRSSIGDKDKYKDSVLSEIRKTYKVMLDEGSTTVWQTFDGGKAFENAGSLCHGWSAVPIYYYGLFETKQQSLN